MSLPERDARTTPTWLQVPALIGLGALILYFLACFHSGLGEELPMWAWHGRWKMFTNKATWHKSLEAEVLADQQWQPVDLSELFPTRWESGYRYSRASFWGSPRRLGLLSNATCVRMDPAPLRVRLYEVKWKVTVGSPQQPRAPDKKLTKTLVSDWQCGTSVADYLPNGWIL